jgi:hypothetical protein
MPLKLQKTAGRLNAESLQSFGKMPAKMPTKIYA